MSGLLGLAAAYDSDASSESSSEAPTTSANNVSTTGNSGLAPGTSHIDGEGEGTSGNSMFAALPAASTRTGNTSTSGVDGTGDKKKKKKKKKKKRTGEDPRASERDAGQTVHITSRVTVPTKTSNTTSSHIASDKSGSSGVGGQQASAHHSWLPAPQHESIDDMMYRRARAREQLQQSTTTTTTTTTTDTTTDTSTTDDVQGYNSTVSSGGDPQAPVIPATAYNYPVDYQQHQQQQQQQQHQQQAVYAPAMPRDFHEHGGRGKKRRRRGDFDLDNAEIMEVSLNDIRGERVQLQATEVEHVQGPQVFSAEAAARASTFTVGAKGKRKNQLTHLAASAADYEKKANEARLRGAAARKISKGKYGW